MIRPVSNNPRRDEMDPYERLLLEQVIELFLAWLIY